MKERIVKLADQAMKFQIESASVVEILLGMIESQFPYYGFLYLVAREFEPHFMVEIGTDYGLGALHLAMGNPKGSVITIDQDQTKTTHMQELFRAMDVRNITFVNGYSQEESGRFQDDSIDLLFIDGDHRIEYATQDYRLYLPKVKRGGLILIDDIGLDDDMRTFWSSMKDDKINISQIRPKGWRMTDGEGFGIVFP